MTEWCRLSALPIRLCTAPAAASSPAARYSCSADSSSSRPRESPRPDFSRSMAPPPRPRACRPRGRGRVEQRDRGLGVLERRRPRRRPLPPPAPPAGSKRAVSSGSAAAPAPRRCRRWRRFTPDRSRPHISASAAARCRRLSARPRDLRAQGVAHHAVREGVAPPATNPPTPRAGRRRRPRRGPAPRRPRAAARPGRAARRRPRPRARAATGRTSPGPVGQRGQPVAEHVADAGRNLPGAASPARSARTGEDRRHLQGVEGVAPGVLPRAGARARSASGSPARTRSASSGLAERAERRCARCRSRERDVAEEAEQGRMPTARWVAEADDDEHARGQPLDQVAEQHARWRVDPLGVVDDEEHRTVGGQRPQHGGEPVATNPRSLGPGPDRPVAEPLARHPEQAGHGAAAGPHRRRRRQAADPAGPGEPPPPARRAALGVAPADEDRVALPRPPACARPATRWVLPMPAGPDTSTRPAPPATAPATRHPAVRPRAARPTRPSGGHRREDGIGRSPWGVVAARADGPAVGGARPSAPPSSTGSWRSTLWLSAWSSGPGSRPSSSASRSRCPGVRLEGVRLPAGPVERRRRAGRRTVRGTGARRRGPPAPRPPRGAARRQLGAASTSSAPSRSASSRATSARRRRRRRGRRRAVPARAAAPRGCAPPPACGRPSPRASCPRPTSCSKRCGVELPGRRAQAVAGGSGGRACPAQRRRAGAAGARRGCAGSPRRPRGGASPHRPVDQPGWRDGRLRCRISRASRVALLAPADGAPGAVGRDDLESAEDAERAVSRPRRAHPASSIAAAGCAGGHRRLTRARYGPCRLRVTGSTAHRRPGPGGEDDPDRAGVLEFPG